MLKKQLILPAIAVALLAGVYYLSSSGQLPDVKKIVTENKDYLQNEAGVLGEMRHFFSAGVRVVKETCSREGHRTQETIHAVTTSSDNIRIRLNLLCLFGSKSIKECCFALCYLADQVPLGLQMTRAHMHPHRHAHIQACCVLADELFTIECAIHVHPPASQAWQATCWLTLLLLSRASRAPSSWSSSPGVCVCLLVCGCLSRCVRAVAPLPYINSYL